MTRAGKRKLEEFGCPTEGCNKSYSRKEHLQVAFSILTYCFTDRFPNSDRHQLNHNPTQFYRCSLPKCEKKFVRRDLLDPHEERHRKLARMEPPQRINTYLYSPAGNPYYGIYSGSESANGEVNCVQGNVFHNTQDSCGVSYTKLAEFGRPPLQLTVEPSAQASPQSLPPSSLPPPISPPALASKAPSRNSGPTSISTHDLNEGICNQQSDLDMTLWDQMRASNTMPEFGGGGYNGSPFAIPKDFVFSEQQIDVSSQQAYAKSVPMLLVTFPLLTLLQLSRCTEPAIFCQ